MVKINIKPLSIQGLKVYKSKSPSKYADKFGNLDLDNIPKEYMRKGVFPSMNKDGTPEMNDEGQQVMKEEEYFDSIQYRKDILAPKPKTPIDPSLVPPAPVAQPLATAPAPDLTPADMGGGFKEGATDVIPSSVNLDNNTLGANRN